MPISYQATFAIHSYVGIFFYQKIYCENVLLYPSGNVQICHNETKAEPPTLSFTCEIKASVLTWTLLYGVDNVFKSTLFAYGLPNHSVNLTSEIKANVTLQSSSLMTSVATASISDHLIPLRLSCGIDLLQYKMFSLVYKGKVQ